MINIITAYYSNKDVTDIIKSKFIDENLSFFVSNNIFGDPNPNIIKYLNITYDDNGIIKKSSFRENTYCTFPYHVDNSSYKIKRKVKFIVPLPDSSYYLWQILVQINNFRKLGYEIDTHYPVCYFNDKPSDILNSMINSNNIKSEFHLYKDNREDKTYSASMKPWLMSQYFKEFPEEKNCVYIYLDPDVIFFEHLNIDEYIDDDIWYESNTCSYLDSKYIKSKGEQLFYDMCDIVNIDPQKVIDNDFNCGGAQYITKNNTFEYWNEVEKTSVILYKHMIETSDKYKTDEQIYPIQAWTSEMWTTNWCLWKRNIKTQCLEELEFHWANHNIEDLKFSIYHNAGVVNNDGEHFSKTAYQTSPFNKETKGKENSISYKYIKEIKETEENFKDIIW